jgi:transposase InsO family protein
MHMVFTLLLSAVLPSLRDRAALQLELVALRHQLAVLERKRTTRLRLTRFDRFFWVWLYRLWPGCLDAVVIVQPETVIRWHRRGFRLFWRWKSRPRRRGRPPMPQETRELIRRMSRENPLWGAPRIHGELRKLGIEISQATVSKVMVRHPRPPSQTWRTFLTNHADGLASIDLFVVPTATFRLLYAFIVLRHERRKVVHFDVTSHPTANWLAQQLVEAFPWDTAPQYLIRDRDAAFGSVFRSRLNGMGILEVLTAPRSPWQNAFVERIIGSIRRECLDHVIVLNARHLRRILSSYFDYYHRSRTHLSLAKDCPDPRPVCPRGAGKFVAFPQVGGLHHRYERLVA